MNDKPQAAASFLINYQNAIQQLNVQYSYYINVMLEVESKTALTEEGKQTVQNVAQLLRQHCILVMISYNALYNSNEKLKVNGKVLKAYEHIKANYIMDRKILEEFINLINETLLQDIIKDLLNTSQEIFKQIYASQ